MSKKEQRRHIEAFFDYCCTAAGDRGWEAAAWSSLENQQRLFQCVQLVGDLNNGTILDVGCGQGCLYEYLDRPEGYKGIDVSEKMILLAIQKYPEANIEHKDLHDVEEMCDWAVAVGPFNLDLGPMQWELLKENIEKMYSLARKGIVFTVLSAQMVERKHQQKGLYYYEPTDILDMCLSINKHVALDHLSEPTQLIVYMPKI